MQFIVPLQLANPRTIPDSYPIAGHQTRSGVCAARTSLPARAKTSHQGRVDGTGVKERSPADRKNSRVRLRQVGREYSVLSDCDSK